MVINLRIDLNIPKNNLWYTIEKRQRESVGFEPFDKVGPVTFCNNNCIILLYHISNRITIFKLNSFNDEHNLQ
jgi:hypothetical protein